MTDNDEINELVKIQADRIVKLEKELKRYKMAWNMAENELEAQTNPLSDEEIVQLKAEIAAYKKTNELLAQKIEQLEKELSK